ncbi:MULTISPECIES: hypothetical protein [Pseudomonas]|uniref:Uncharacterized protein n=1 Tax=Pseudomonas idahonensis TaxID=2942628 RepID=A0ABT5Q8X6_9PSED|nr:MULTISPECIES: hypothetical protein [Pseudomonas]MBW8354077.1 hypothetical protein [Pseudomonas sp.]MDD1150186.1 hypothetical protein [Pseudomonas idahonensis]MDP9511527.1 hypothetical protein [Pseudomonas protegens]MDP9517823.1 hypothetical protein [Pseudomonas protegens]
MAMPERLKPTPPMPKTNALMKDLLEQILDRIWDNQGRESPEINALIQQWNSHAGRPFEFHEFLVMHSHTSAENFLRTAFHQKRYVDDLSFDEACAVADFICQCEGTESDTDYALGLLETNFPEANASDLIFWPNAWFDDEDLLHIELSSAQIIGYLMAKSSRPLQDAPPITLPYAIPQNRS